MIINRRRRVSELSDMRQNVYFRKIKAHAGNKLNEEVDKLAKSAIGLIV